MKNRFLREANLIAGDWINPERDSELPVANPATGKVIGRVPRSGQLETRRAIEAAAKAFRSFRKHTAIERAGYLHRMHDLILKHREDLAVLLTAEQGKPLAESRGEITISAAYLAWFAEEARRINGRIVPSPWPDRHLQVTHHPVGVVAAITPWNFPTSMLARKVGPAIAAGCTCVIKPASQTPFSALAWGVLAEMAGLPPGVLNIVTGSASEIGAELTEHPAVRKLTFTGSTAVGKILLRQCADSVKKVSMELGGNAPFIVFEDADLERAVDGAVAAKYRNSGQTCVCANRFFVHEKVYDRFKEMLVARTEALVVGPGNDPETEQGPLIDTSALEAIEALVRDASQRGAQIATGGGRHALGGTYFQPTVLTDVTPDMHVSRKEIFGPVSALIRFVDEMEVLDLANDTEAGLACYVYTRDMRRAMRLRDQLEYGLIGLNEGLITTVEAPFGGCKESGLGTEGGAEGIYEYLNTRYTCIGGV